VGQGAGRAGEREGVSIVLRLEESPCSPGNARSSPPARMYRRRRFVNALGRRTDAILPICANPQIGDAVTSAPGSRDMIGERRRFATTRGRGFCDEASHSAFPYRRWQVSRLLSLILGHATRMLNTVAPVRLGTIERAVG
jgi:hypothetical protein